MIIYNMRERGPLEYDKFVMNTFQYINMVNYYIQKYSRDDFINKMNSFDDIYNSILSLSEEIYMKYKILEA